MKFLFKGSNQKINKDPVNDFFSKHRPSLLRYAHGIVNDPHRAEDLVQDAYLKIMTNANKTKIGNLQAYFFKTLRNLCIDQISNRKNMVDVEKTDLPSTEDILRRLAGKDEARLLHEMIQTLPEKQKTVILLKDVEGYTYAEIKEILQVSENNLRVNLSIARKKIREMFNNLEAY